MQPPARRPSDSEGLLRAAFRELHGARLHGFALLVTLGDRRLAARLAADALAEGSRHVPELMHPERAGAWLRRRVLRGASRSRPGRVSRDERLLALGPIGVDRETLETLESFTVAERGALVASVIERLEPLDLEVVLRADGRSVHRQSVKVRHRFLTRRAARAPRTPLAASRSPRGDLLGVGQGGSAGTRLADRVEEISASVIARRR